MALVPCGKDQCFDTDDLEQAEYHYYCKARKLRRHCTATKILRGEIDAYDIENSDKYKWLASD